MDGSFEDRVKRLFSSRLFDPLPGDQDTSSSSSLWSVACGEVERREWNRGGGNSADGGGESDDRENDPCASAFDDEGRCLVRRIKNSAVADREKKDWEGDLDGLDDDGEGEDDDDGGIGGRNREEMEIRASIGLDPTVDREEEEDEYDIRACNSEDTGDRLYMRDVIARNPYLNIHAVVPEIGDDSIEEVHDFSRDPRADHFAASVRLQEDDNAVESGHSAVDPRNRDSSLLQATKISPRDIKSILKRKGSQADPKPKKRVRFDSGCKDEEHLKNIEAQKDCHAVPYSLELNSVSNLPEGPAGVPDYLRNPSKYTCYTLDWSEKDDNDMNKEAFNDFLSLIKKSNTDLNGTPMELPKSITFTSRKKLQDAMSVDNGSGDVHGVAIEAYSQRTACFVDVAAGDISEHDACDMEEETSVVEASVRATKAGRKYRSKSSSDDST